MLACTYPEAHAGYDPSVKSGCFCSMKRNFDLLATRKMIGYSRCHYGGSVAANNFYYPCNESCNSNRSHSISCVVTHHRILATPNMWNVSTYDMSWCHGPLGFRILSTKAIKCIKDIAVAQSKDDFLRNKEGEGRNDLAILGNFVIHLRWSVPKASLLFALPWDHREGADYISIGWPQRAKNKRAMAL